MITRFESSVNSEGIETKAEERINASRFESSVNSEGIETNSWSSSEIQRLRAV